VEKVILLCAIHALIIIFLLWRRDKQLFKEEIESHKNETKKTLSQKKSSEVRTGQIAEHFAPLLKDFKYDRKQARFLATPIDFIIFEEEEIIFMEVKTGKSRLNTNQRRIKKQVEEKKIRWETLRIE
jgi:predicted Holliday junction resolvase-like endonuclease